LTYKIDFPLEVSKPVNAGSIRMADPHAQLININVLWKPSKISPSVEYLEKLAAARTEGWTV
jgi:hypothetical protein